MKKFLIFTFSLVCVLNLHAQVSGVSGKRGVIKTDLVNYAVSKGFNISFEYAITRRMSIDFEYRIKKDEMLPRYNQFVDVAEIKGKKFQVNQQYFTTSLRFYDLNAFNAPKGTFYYTKLGYGIAEIDGYTYIKEFNVFGQREINYYDFKATGVKLIPIEIGYGKQWIIKNYFTIEISGGYNMTIVAPDQAPNKIALDPITQRIGPSIPLSGYYLLGYGASGLAHGISLNVRMGLMTPF